MFNSLVLIQLGITSAEIAHRKSLFGFSEEDSQLLLAVRPLIETQVESILEQFHQAQADSHEISHLHNHKNTWRQLYQLTRNYVVDLFGGCYEVDYIASRLQIGMLHNQVGLSPKFYMAAMQSLKAIIVQRLGELLTPEQNSAATIAAVDKILLLEMGFVFDNYMRGLINEAQSSLNEMYARTLEKEVKARTQQLETLVRTDPLTNLMSVRYLSDTLNRALHSAKRRMESITLVYMDVNNFKMINDAEGHLRGDAVLRAVGHAIKSISRLEDSCFRYGGDEFCLILPKCTKLQAQTQYLHRLNQTIHKNEPNLTISAGLAQAGPHFYPPAEQLIQEADMAMYQSKRLFKMEMPPISYLRH